MAVRHFNSLSQSSPASIAAQSASKFSLKDAGSGGFSVSDVFSVDVYAGDSSARSFVNGVDLSDEGGLVWIKSTSDAFPHLLFDSNRGHSAYLRTNGTFEEFSVSDILTGFNKDGFDLGSNLNVNGSGRTYEASAFRKYPRFFDVVTYSGNSVAGRQIPHNLAVAPGMVVVKKRNAAQDWIVFHKITGGPSIMLLNSTTVAYSNAAWNNTAPNASTFTVGSDSKVNASGDTYVAYLFAHDTDENGLIQCGAYSGNSSTTGPLINLGWTPQWLIVKRATGASGQWWMFSNARDPVGNFDNVLRANTDNAAFDNHPQLKISLNANGFQPITTDSELNASGSIYTYMAIRAEGA